METRNKKKSSLRPRSVRIRKTKRSSPENEEENPRRHLRRILSFFLSSCSPSFLCLFQRTKNTSWFTVSPTCVPWINQIFHRSNCGDLCVLCVSLFRKPRVDDAMQGSFARERGELIFPHHSRLDPTTTAAACPDDQTRKNSKVSCNTERILMHKNSIVHRSLSQPLGWLGTEMPRKGTAQFLNSFAPWNRPSLFLAHLPSKSRLGDSNIAMARRDTIVQLSETYIPLRPMPRPSSSSSF